MGDGLRMGDCLRMWGGLRMGDRLRMGGGLRMGGDIVRVVENRKLSRITGRAADKKQLD